ncbi:TPA: hypothetical protein ACH3X2_012882 [Trebouxia sp. C0005]
MVVPLFLGTADECFLAADDSLVQSAGTGPTVTALYDGQQTCNFLDQELASVLTSGQCCTAFAVSAARSLLAYSLTGTPDRLQLVVLSPATHLTTLQQQHPAANCAYSNAAVSLDGLHLLALCGPHQPYIELWALSPLQPLLTQDVLPYGTGAVPAKGRPATTWGHDSPLTAEPLPGWECTSSILHIHLTQQHLVVMHASADSSAAASAIWLDNHSLQQIARLALPTNTCHAWTDLSLSKAVVSTTCGSVFTFSIHPQGQPASLTLVSKQHVKEVVGLAFLSATSMISVSQDGVAGLWQLQKGTSGVLTAQLCGMQSVACKVTCITAQPDCSTAVIGLSSGQLLHLTVGRSVAATPHSDRHAGCIDEPSTGISDVSSDHGTETGSRLSAALDIVPMPRQHNAAVSAAQMSPDGQLLASTSASDGAVMFGSSLLLLELFMWYQKQRCRVHLVLPGCQPWAMTLVRGCCLVAMMASLW